MMDQLNHLIDPALVQGFGRYLKDNGKQASTIESYCRDATRFIEYARENRVNLGNISPDVMVAFQSELLWVDEERENTVRRAVIGVRQFFRYLVAAGVIVATPMDAVEIPARDETLAPGMDPEDIDELLVAAAAQVPAIKAARDSAMLSLAAFHGLKVGEIIGLKWIHVLGLSAEKGSLRVVGLRDRIFDLLPQVARALKEYREELGRRWPAGREGNVFIAFKGRDLEEPLPTMTRHGVKFILYELGAKAGVKGLNAEALRHFAEIGRAHV